MKGKNYLTVSLVVVESKKNEDLDTKELIDCFLVMQKEEKEKEKKML